MSHQVKQINIICTEPKIQWFYHNNYLIKEGLLVPNRPADYDTIKYANPILDFLNLEKRNILFSQITGMLKLHGAKKIVLIDHFSCGAYQLSGHIFADFSAEVEEHEKINNIVKDFIIKEFPQIEVEIKYINISGDKCEWLENPKDYYIK